MRIRLILLLLSFELLRGGSQTASAVPPFGVYEGASFSPTITVLESNADRVRLHFEMENLPSETPINFNQRLPGLWENLNTDGNPPHLLPRFSIFIALPNTGDPTVVTESWEGALFDVSPTINLQENTPGQPRVIAGSVGILGGVRVIPLTIKPIVYTNNASICSVMTSATISIEIDDQQGTNPVTSPRTAFSRPWQKIFEATVTNWENIANIHVGAESHILMIVPDAYISSVADFVRWKEQRGTKVTIVPESSIGGGNPTAAQVRSRIISEVNSSDPHMDYVILVGDENQLPVSMLFTADPNTRFSTGSGGSPFPGSYTNENFFCAIEGSDVFPDVFLGRWVANSAGEVSEIGAHELAHERNTFNGDSLRFEHAVVSADEQLISQKNTKRKVAQNLAAHGFGDIDSVWGGEQNYQDMINSVDQGQTFVNYRGQGWDFGWYGIQFWVPQVALLNNVRKLPIVTGIGCGVGKFDAPDGQCFGEEWMLAGTVSQPRGAAGFIGPSWNTHTVYNDILDSTLYRSFLDYDVQNLMPALVSGEMMEWAIMHDFLDESPVLEIVNTLFRQYHVLSDPSLQVFTDTPLRLNAIVPDAIQVDPNASYTVTINNMNMVEADSVQVTAWLSDSQFVTQWIPQGFSSTTITLNTEVADTMVVTLTGDNVLALQQGVVVGSAIPYPLHVAASLHDSTVGNGNGLIEPGETIDWYEVVQNIASVDALDVSATISSATPGINITQPTVVLGTILSNETITSSTPFTFAVAPDALVGPNLDFILTFNMSNGPTRQTPVMLVVHTPTVLLESAQVVDDNNSFWDRDETVNLRITVLNSGDINLASGTYTLSTTDTLVTILSGETTAPMIGDSSSYTFPDDAFVVHSSWATPAGHLAMLTLSVSADMGTYTYTDEVPIQLIIGQVASSDPFTDIGGHFWVYDNTDSLYTERPAYEWIEIAPNAGGLGLEIPFSNGNQTRYYPVPFDYNYYGLTFDSLSISTDGWVRPGRTTRTNFFNLPLPTMADSIFGLIAPLWFNLWASSGETGQICYFYDPTLDRFIVEWYQIHDLSGTFAETFQMQLLNPATYPTESGDAEWMFLYQEVSPRATHSSVGATIGLESFSQTNGFTYIYHGALTTGAAPLVAGRAIKVTTEPPVILSATPQDQVPLPSAIELRSNYPNPFNPETTIEFALPRADHVTLIIFDVLGRQVATLIDGRVEAGTHHARWRGAMDSGVSASSGVYFYRLETSSEAITRKMILLR